jgi:hypothetical protein
MSCPSPIRRCGGYVQKGTVMTLWSSVEAMAMGVGIAVVERSTNLQREGRMAKELDKNETASFEELLISNMIEIQAVTQLLVEKGIITKQEYYGKLKSVQKEYDER